MIGMDVGFEYVLEAQPELLDQRRVPPHLLENRIDDDRRTAAGIGEQISIGGGWRIKELSEDEHRGTPGDVADHFSIGGWKSGETVWPISSLPRSPRATGSAGPNCGAAISISTQPTCRRRFTIIPGNGWLPRRVRSAGSAPGLAPAPPRSSASPTTSFTPMPG